MSRKRLILLGFLPILFVSIFIVGVLLLGHLPGFAGEVFAKFAGFMFTPFFLEGTFICLGTFLVFWINHLRGKYEGDDFVEIEIKEDPKQNNS